MRARLKQALSGIALLVLAVFCWQATANTRLEVYNGDPYSYLHAAQTLRAGEGLRNYTFQPPHDPRAQEVVGPADAPFTTWPPLYPMLLAAFGADLPAARIINAVSLWVTFILLWRLYADYRIHAGVRIATGIAYLALVVGDRQTLLSASSEALFYPLTLAYLIALARVKDTRWLIVAVVIAVALPLTRYIGAACVAAGALVIWRRRGWKCASLVSGPPMIGLGLWFARNIVLTAALTGNTRPGAYTAAVLVDIMEISLQWMTAIVILSLPLVCPSLIWHLWQRHISSRSLRVD